MNAFNSIFSGNVAQALGWALVHSVWQIALVSLVLAAILVVIRDKSPRLRYLIAIGSLGIIFIISIITFFSVLDSTPKTLTTAVKVYSSQITYSQMFFDTSTSQNLISSWLNNLTGYVQQNLNLLLTAWIIGVVILSIRLTGGITYIIRLRNKNLKPAEAIFNTKLQKLVKRFDLTKSVQLYESALVKVPTVIGYLKPYILVPIGTFTALPANQIEAILAHELAHIKRNDYLINIFQSVLEIVYFFHPGIWWISNTIRKERELCCDDLAVQSGCDAITLARALTTIEELSINQPNTTLAMAFTGKGSLLNRIKRLIGHTEKNSSALNGVSGTVIILITALITFTVNSSTVFSSTLKNKSAARKAVYTETIPVEKASLTTISSFRPSLLDDSIRINKNLKIDDRDALVIVKDDKGDVKDIRINGKSVPKENWNEEELQTLINNRLGAPVPPTPPAPFGITAPVPPAAPAKPCPHGAPKCDAAALPPLPAVPPMPPMSFDFPGFNFNLDMSDYKADMTPAERRKFEKKMEKFGKEMEAKSKEWEQKFGKEWEAKMEKEWEPQMKIYEQQMDDWAKTAQPHLDAMVAANLSNLNFSNFDSGFNFNYNENSTSTLETQLINDGLIKANESYQFSISGKNKELMINGKKQSAELFQKYDKLIKGSNKIKSDDYSISISK